jgi:hypothetical protein
MKIIQEKKLEMVQFGMKKVLLWEHLGNRVPIRTLYLAAEESLNFNILLLKIRENMTFKDFA